MIEQIYIDKNGDVILSPRIGNHKVIFGDLKDIEVKFNKLYTFYKNIAPEKGWERYSEVNLKYNNQIVCKLKKKRKK
jgi:cell division protein FtsQ